MLPGKSKFHPNFFIGINRKIFHAPSCNLSLKTINRKCNSENEVSSRRLAVLKNSIFWKSSSCENVCSAIYDETLNKNRFPHLNCTQLVLSLLNSFMITAAFIKELISNEQVRSVTVERNCSCEIVALLKKYVVKKQLF